MNVLPGEIDIFQYNNFNIFINIIDEITYFIGLNEEDNESLGYNFCKIFENYLSTIIQDNFQRNKILNCWKKLFIKNRTFQSLKWKFFYRIKANILFN